MKSDYEEKTFEFFTQRENFETMLKVASQAEGVCKRLIYDFWAQLAESLTKVLGDRDEDWRVGFSDNWDYRWNKLWMYQEEWCKEENYPVVSIAFEELQPNRHPYLGLHIGYDHKKFNGSNIKKDLLDIETLKEYQTDSNNYWAVWKHLPFGLSGLDSLVQLLPENKMQTSQNVVNEALYLIGLIKNDINVIIEKNRI